MPVVAYSHEAVEALPDPIPPRRQQEHSVFGRPGLLVVVGRGGTKSWYLRYQLRGRRRKMKLGDFPAMSVRDAAKKAERHRDNIKESAVDPMGEPPEEGGTFGELCGVYLKAMTEGKQKLAPATLKEWRRILESPELKNLRAMHPTDIRDRDVARALDPFETRDALVMLNRVQGAISAVFGWAVTRHRYGLESNPVRKMARRYEESPKERTLDAVEIGRVWMDLEDRTPLFRTALRLTLLTGQRPGEVRRMRWRDIDGSTWTMPRGYRKKTAADKGRPTRPHRVHLTPPVLAELERIRGFERGGLVFPARSTGEPHRPIGRHSLARVAARMSRRLDMDRWTPHDFRRTARTHWSDPLKVDPIVAEKLLGHALPKILRTYDRGEQWEDRVEALERWAEYVALQVKAR